MKRKKDPIVVFPLSTRPKHESGKDGFEIFDSRGDELFFVPGPESEAIGFIERFTKEWTGGQA